MLIKVSAEHLKDELRGKGEARRDTCPVARALRDATGMPWSVGTENCWCEGGDLHRLPTEVTKKIEQIDDRMVANPPPFEFELPEKIIEQTKAYLAKQLEAKQAKEKLDVDKGDSGASTGPT